MQYYFNQSIFCDIKIILLALQAVSISARFICTLGSDLMGSDLKGKI